MKKLNYIAITVSAICIMAVIYSFTLVEKGYEFKTITVIESIVPNGIGRSRIINSLGERDFREFSKVMTEDDNSRN